MCSRICGRFTESSIPNVQNRSRNVKKSSSMAKRIRRRVKVLYLGRDALSTRQEPFHPF